jgi:hypothetical protein
MSIGRRGEYGTLPVPGNFGDNPQRIRRTESGTLARIAALHVACELFDYHEQAYYVGCLYDEHPWPCLTQQIIDGEV